jgi:DNA-binding CsgD family transcriptional regulator
VSHRVTSRELIGREVELRLLSELTERATAGAGGAALVAGDAGVGKSRLITDFGERAVAAGMLVLRGECVNLAETELTFGPIIGALRDATRGREETALHTLLGPARAELSRLLPELGGDPPAAERPDGRARLFESLLGLLTRLGEEQPVLLVIEDVHWADGASLDLLTYLMRNLRTERLAIVVSMRSDELAPDHPLRARAAEWQRGERVQHIQLEPLTTDQVRRQVERILGAAPSPALLEQLFERTQGNPFFTEELLAAGAERELPRSLRDALLLRLGRLSGRGRAIVGIAAVAGRSIDHRLLAVISAPADPEPVTPLREAVANHVLVSDGLRYAFRHALLREAVYDDLHPGERAPVHAAIAAALVGHPELAESAATLSAEIAHHWMAAGCDAPALLASLQAGEDAQRLYDVAEARRHYERTLALWERVPDPAGRSGATRPEILARAAEAAFLSGDEPAAVAAARAALRDIDADREPRRAAMVHERLATYLWSAGDSEGSLLAARRAVELIPADPPSASRARALAALGRMCVMRSENLEARDHCAAAVAAARAAGAREEEGYALVYLGSALAFLGDYDSGISTLREAVGLLRTLPPAARGCAEYENLSEFLADTGRLEEAHAVAEDGIGVAGELGVERSYGVVLLGRTALCAVTLGRLREADGLCARALHGGSSTFFAYNALEAQGRMHVLRGEFTDAERVLSAARAMAAQLGDLMFAGPVAAVRGELALWRGRPHDAIELATATLGPATARECLQHTSELHAIGARAFADLATAGRATRDSGRARSALDGAEALSERLAQLIAASLPLGGPPARLRADAALCAAEVCRARGEADTEAWQAALHAVTESGSVPRAAYARWRLAESALDNGDRDRARVALADATRAADAAGLSPLLHELRSLARRARLTVEPDREATSAVDAFGLTPREIEVLLLLADGLTNRSIAARLYVSEKTTEKHVAHIMSKLDVRTRGEAGAIAHRLGLIERVDGGAT